MVLVPPRDPRARRRHRGCPGRRGRPRGPVAGGAAHRGGALRTRRLRPRHGGRLQGRPRGVSGRPVALVTGEVSPYRREPFALLAQAEGLEVLAWGAPDDEPAGGSDLTVRHTTQAGAARLVGSGRYRAVVAGLGGRIALAATYAAARRARIPFVLWASLWEHPRSPVHALSYLPVRHLYRHADAVVTYGPHVSRYVERQSGHGAVFDAPQACSAELRVPAEAPERAAWRERMGIGDDGSWRCSPAASCARRRRKGAAGRLGAIGLGSGGGVLALAGYRPAGTRRRGGPAAESGARLARARRTSGRCTRPPTCWSCRRSAPRRSPSPGAWSRTRPCTRQRPR